MGYDYWIGHDITANANAQERPAGFETDGSGALYPKIEKYMQKICALCRGKDVPLLLIKTPYVTNINDTKIYNRAAQIAAEYGASFVNFNYLIDDIGMDFSQHYADMAHMNYKGSHVFSRYLGAYIKARYDIPDRRGDAGYDSYRIMAANERERVKRLEAAAEEDVKQN